MGAFYNSICVPGVRPEEVRRLLTRWLGMRGFEPSDEPLLFDLDGANERSAFLLSNDHWTLLFFSHYEEERRLIHELQALSAPLLYVWVYDSDVWGYDLFHQYRFEGSYSSNPQGHVSFEDELPGSEERPWADPARLCELLDMPGEEDTIRRLQRRQGTFRADVCRTFCQKMGVEAALASYDDLECGMVSSLGGWHAEQLLFGRGDGKAFRDADLHTYRVKVWAADLGGGTETAPVVIPPELLAEVRRMRQRMRIRMLLIKPLSWLATAWRAVREAAYHLRGMFSREASPVPDAGSPLPVNYRQEGERLINDRHGCSIQLPAGAVPSGGSRKPASVFAFRIEGTHVTCTGRRLSKIGEVLRQPSRSNKVRDERYEVGGLRARHLLFEMPHRFSPQAPSGPTYLGLHVIQTSNAALYVFLYRLSSLPQDAVERAIREAVESFRLASS